MSFGPFVTRRLKLDPLEPADADSIAALHADPRLTAHLLDGIPRTPAEALIYVRWAEALGALSLGVVAARRHDASALLGLFSLTPFEATGELELGGKLARAGWGSNLAFEAGSCLIDYAFEVQGRDTLVSACHPDNRSVPAVLARLGFEPAGEASVFGRKAMLMRLSRSCWRSAAKRND